VIAFARDREVEPISEVLAVGFGAGYVKAPLDPRELSELTADVADMRQRDPETEG
jgi:hypothetical protein